MGHRLKIEREGSDLVVRIAGPMPNAEGFHDAVKAYRRTGVWACPSGECVRIDRCDVPHDGDTIVLRLGPVGRPDAVGFGHRRVRALRRRQAAGQGGRLRIAPHDSAAASWASGRRAVAVPAPPRVMAPALAPGAGPTPCAAVSLPPGRP